MNLSPHVGQAKVKPKIKFSPTLVKPKMPKPLNVISFKKTGIKMKIPWVDINQSKFMHRSNA